MQSPTQSPNTAESSSYLDDLFEGLELTENQALTIIIAAKISTFLSLIGSTYVMQDILRDHRKRNESIYHRTILGVATSDFIVAFGFFLGTWAMPKSENTFAKGTNATCIMTGFSNMLGALLSPLYNCSLATYYSLELKYNWVEWRLKAIEKWLHIVPWTLSIISPLVALFMDELGPSGFMCFIDTGISLVISAPLYVVTIIYVIVVMFMVYKHIRDIEVNGMRYSITLYSPPPSSSQAAQRKRSRRVMIQGIMYAVAMMLVFLPYLLSIFVSGYVSLIQVYILSPLQGFYNAIIYSELLQKWFYNNDGCCRCCSLSFIVTTIKSSFAASTRMPPTTRNKRYFEQKEEEKTEESASSLPAPKSNDSNMGRNTNDENI